MRRIIRLFFGVALGLIVLLFSSLLSRWFGAFVFALPFGWYRFLERTVSNVTINWSAIGLAVICTVLILWLGHLLARQTSRRVWGTTSFTWPFRRTLAGFLIFCWMFIVVMAASGLYRAAAWAARTDEPLYVERNRWVSDMRMAVSEVQMLLLEEQGAARIVRGKLTTLATAMTPTPGNRIPWERWNVVVSEQPDGAVKQVFVIPRETQALERLGATIVGREGTMSTITAAELRQVLREVR